MSLTDKTNRAEERVAIAVSKLTKLRNQLDKKNNIAKQKEERLHTRRKILLGALILNKYNGDHTKIAESTKEELDIFLTRNIDRSLFGLERLIDIPANCSEGKKVLVDGGAVFAWNKGQDAKTERWKVHDENFDDLKKRIDEILQVSKVSDDKNSSVVSNTKMIPSTAAPKSADLS